MKTTLMWIALALPLGAQDTFDFGLLEKLGANAANRTNITLDGDMLKLAGGLIGGKSGSRDGDSIKPIVDSLQGVYIRSWEFDKEGQYNEADMNPLRDYLKQHQWAKIVEVHEKKESSEIWTLPRTSSRLGGIAILSAEPKEATVVYINGSLKTEDIAKLGGNLGIPDIKTMQDAKKKLDEGKPQKPKDED